MELRKYGFETQWVGIRSDGDKFYHKPLSSFTERGVFTKALDEELLKGRIDIAVHSLKDCPAKIHPELTLGAVLARDYHSDVFIYKDPELPLDNPDHSFEIATGSTRRRAQWKFKYPNSRFIELRGNVPNRLKKLDGNSWDGIILSRAGLTRLDIRPPLCIELSWMVPAPGQGVICAVCRNKDSKVSQILEKIDHKKTRVCVELERAVMHILEYSCEAPVGALASWTGSNQISLEISASSPGNPLLYLKEIISVAEPFNPLSVVEKFIMNNPELNRYIK